jgi:LysR family transcriptional regulator, hydrogen peroxide-inducible genes activator
MEMHQIRYFLAVSEYLNFRRAAEKCHVSAPALTRAIQKLEDEIGGKLFRRERNLTHLTDLGTLIRPQLKHVLFEAEGAKIRAKQFLKLEHAPVKLGVMCTIGPIYFMGFLSDFQAKHPGVELTLIDGTAERGGLDPEHGGGRLRGDLSAGVLCGDTRRDQQAVDKTGSDA